MRTLRILAIVVLALMSWISAASFLLCFGMERLDLFTFPYDQWLDLAACWRCMVWWPHGADEYRTHPLPWFLLSGLLPTVVLSAGVWKWLRYRPSPSLYGDSQWAGSADLEAAGISRRRRS
jgi:hypothetical protein